jgi:predicted DNA-binding ribbon-helix-helix protein
MKDLLISFLEVDYGVLLHRKTSVSLERPFWDALREIAISSDRRLTDLVSKID